MFSPARFVSIIGMRSSSSLADRTYFSKARPQVTLRSPPIPRRPFGGYQMFCCAALTSSTVSTSGRMMPWAPRSMTRFVGSRSWVGGRTRIDMSDPRGRQVIGDVLQAEVAVLEVDADPIESEFRRDLDDRR